MRGFLRLLLGVTACGVLIFSGLQLYDYYKEAHISSKVNDSMAEDALVYLAQETGSENEAAGIAVPAEAAPVSVDFDVLRETGRDIVGWLYCEDTPINYPIVQGEDNIYYLRHLPDGTYNRAGSIFMDCRGSADFSDLNTIVYGHNQQNDSMFGTLTNYGKQSYYEKHPVFWLLTPDADYRLELVAGYVTGNDAEIYSGVRTEEELAELVKNAIGQSTFSSGVTLNANDRVVTLSTCSYDYENARYVLLARMIELTEGS